MTLALQILYICLAYAMVGFFGTSIAHLIFKKTLGFMDGISLCLGVFFWPLLAPCLVIYGTCLGIGSVSKWWINMINSHIEDKPTTGITA